MDLYGNIEYNIIIKEKQKQLGKPKAAETMNHIPVSRPSVGNSQEDDQGVA